MKKVTDDLKRVFRKAGLKGAEAKQALRDVVAELWPDLPPWSTLNHPVIEEEQKASIGCGVLLTFRENGTLYTVLGQAGAHYTQNQEDGAEPLYTIPGGFMNLTETVGSDFVASSEAAESPRIAAARETEEEFKLPDGQPVLSVDPERLMPMDTVTISFPNGQKRVVIGMMLELTAQEVDTFRTHIGKLSTDAAYKEAVAAQTANEDSKLPEICDLKIVSLSDVIGGRSQLLHTDQLSLFKIVQGFYNKFAPRPHVL